MDAKPLPTSRNPSGQNPNLDIRKLAIKMRTVASTTLSVAMVPLSTGQEPPTQIPSVTRLAEW